MEVAFKGSVLETELRNCNNLSNLNNFKILTANALESQPQSIFWKDAMDYITNKLKKIK